MRYHPPVGKSWQEFYSKWYIASFFGEPRNGYFHSGDDLNLKTGGDSDLGEPAYAVAKGPVLGIDKSSTVGFGKQLYQKIDFEGAILYIGYNHLFDVVAESGDQLEPGDLIGHVGKSGTKWAHLHFSVKKKANGMDNVPNTKTELLEWENPSKILAKMSSISQNGGSDMTNMYPSNAPQIDLNNEESVKAAVDTWVKVVNGEFINKSDVDSKVRDAEIRAMSQAKNETIKNIKEQLGLTEDFSDASALVRAIKRLMSQGSNGDGQSGSPELVLPEFLKKNFTENGAQFTKELPEGKLTINFDRNKEA